MSFFTLPLSEPIKEVIINGVRYVPMEDRPEPVMLRPSECRELRMTITMRMKRLTTSEPDLEAWKLLATAYEALGGIDIQFLPKKNSAQDDDR